MSDDEKNQAKAARHKERMAQRKALVDAAVARATEERGVVIVLTGDGKGKSSSAFGTALRAAGHGFKVGIAQFIKGTWECGERNILAKLPNVEFHVMGTGFTWETQDAEQDKAAAQACWAECKHLLADESVRLVVFDELTYMLNYKYLDKDEVLATIKARPKDQSVIITGRGAKKYLEELADTFSEVKSVKHAFHAGVAAQKGIEW
ncbi:cob(I)yrinic acid a,c-diamide adenosyltransferase [Simiduia sp. 21SJ11W-1]|uniref:cob(I)yrinic acid a,c-diamide adenosyltransferase n=1 Tax=Simiduia sp. 21SJ11W-1 TaxID=2909669 RepID=UPI00209E18E0|nr:cob(I)yrinic acid a,c-diamide adenosyltransferase [Simiduia sp. 21SJ11W-1]UTA48529.1 cob(I)yrinic acid a,c-diamide adenosyltransferase [Simiduia sp. 21SJ11W-1]